MSVILVTGGTGAIGSAIAEEFSKTDDVIFTYNVRESEAMELKKRLCCECVQMNTADFGSVEVGAKEILKRFGKIDILVNNAGISLIKPLYDTTCDEWKKIIDVNLTGVFNVTKAITPSMVRRKNGTVVNISSVWGVYGASCEAAYSASKAGVIGFTKAMAKELGPSGITVNAIAPGVIESPMNAHLSDRELSELAEETPLGRLGKPAEVAKAVRALAENRFITGQVLGVDGGFY